LGKDTVELGWGSLRFVWGLVGGQRVVMVFSWASIRKVGG